MKGSEGGGGRNHGCWGRVNADENNVCRMGKIHAVEIPGRGRCHKREDVQGCRRCGGGGVFVNAGIMGADGPAFFEAQNTVATVRTQERKDSLKRAKIWVSIYIAHVRRVPTCTSASSTRIPQLPLHTTVKRNCLGQKKLVEGENKVAAAIIHSSYSGIGGIRTNFQRLVDLARRGFVKATTACAKRST